MIKQREARNSTGRGISVARLNGMVRKDHREGGRSCSCGGGRYVCQEKEQQVKMLGGGLLMAMEERQGGRGAAVEEAGRVERQALRLESISSRPAPCSESKGCHCRLLS